MRERLVVLLVALTLAVIALFAIPRAYAIADVVQGTEQARVTRAVDVMAVAIAAQRDRAPVTQLFLASLREPGERLVYTATDGTRVVSGSATADESDFARTEQLPGGGTITVSLSDDVVSGEVSKALLPIIALALALSTFAALVALVAARRLARPFQQLAHTATEIGNGRFDVEVPHFSIPEAEEIGDALRRASRQLDQLVRRERDFAITASHELRTPITALRLSLEDLTLWQQTPADVAAELTSSMAEVDRLSAAITHLLERDQDGIFGTPVDIDLTTLARAAVDRWRPAADERGRTIALRSDPVVPASLVPGPVDQVIDMLIENALAHGSGHITVNARAADTHLQLLVADQGTRTLPTGVLHESTGDDRATGLSRAAGLAESMGGYLSVVDAPLTRVVLALPTISASTLGSSA